MTLGEFVKLQKPGTMMHINATTSFFMVVTPEEFEEESKKLEKSNLRHYKLSLMENQEKLQRALNRKISIKAEESVADYIKRVTFYIQKIKDYQYGINTATTYLNQYTPIPDRKVLESSDRISNDGIIVNVTGNEPGKYWDRKEWEDDHAR